MLDADERDLLALLDKELNQSGNSNASKGI